MQLLQYTFHIATTHILHHGYHYKNIRGNISQHDVTPHHRSFTVRRYLNETFHDHEKAGKINGFKSVRFLCECIKFKLRFGSHYAGYWVEVAS